MQRLTVKMIFLEVRYILVYNIYKTVQKINFRAILEYFYEKLLIYIYTDLVLKPMLSIYHKPGSITISCVWLIIFIENILLKFLLKCT